MAICPDCEQLKKSKDEVWRAYQEQKRRNNSGLFKELKTTEETDRLLEEYKIASARLRHHLAVKHTEQGHRVSESDLRLLENEDGPVSC
jgi:hypothetical protein